MKVINDVNYVMAVELCRSILEGHDEAIARAKEALAKIPCELRASIFRAAVGNRKAESKDAAYHNRVRIPCALYRGSESRLQREHRLDMIGA